LDPSIALAGGNKGKWREEEDSKLAGAVKTHGGENWETIAALVPGRTKSQCSSRWHTISNPNIDRTPPGRTGKWEEDEDSKLKDAVQTHGGKNWATIATLVPGRTKQQCRNRWNCLDSSIDGTAGRTGKWAQDEDSKLKDAAQMHGGKNWSAVAALIPGRTQKQCLNRWKDFLDPSIDPNGRTGR
jgi:myb proto-oncogene protein